MSDAPEPVFSAPTPIPEEAEVVAVLAPARQLARPQVRGHVMAGELVLPETIKVGDRIQWCGLMCLVLAVELTTNKQTGRRGRWLTVETGSSKRDSVRRLHWFDNERVEVLS